MYRRAFLKHTAWATILTRYGAGADRARRLRLITRGDDLGCARSLNLAMKECFEKGILKNCSVLAPAPYLEEGVRMLASAKGLCFGLHSALTSEWDSRRWGPVAPRQSVPSLVDAQGFLHLSNDAAQAKVRPDEALIELQAQLDKARGWGSTFATPTST
jgi:chitin disaccharide deacetylase